METKEAKSFITFREIGTYEQSNLTFKEPSCINSNVRINRYKITIELIEEPDIVLIERLQKLWDECDNYHHTNVLKFEAKKLGYELQGYRGNKLNKNQ